MLDPIFDDSVPYELSVFVDDPTKVKTWDLKVTVRYTNYPNVKNLKLFSV